VGDWAHDGVQWTGRLIDLEAIRQSLDRALARSTIQWQLIEPGGGILAGPAVTGSALVLRKAAETGLPWGVKVAVRPEPAGWRGRPLITGLLALGVAILGTLYAAYRAVRRELRVAEMQSEFVAAVSHEFRTPITALTHLTDLLESGEPAEARRSLYYKALARETGRLREMVENLLDFGRIEAGRYRYKPEDVNAADFVRTLVNDFREQPAAIGREVVLDEAAGGITVAVDREAMRRAIWNLLDNAAKYSPNGTRITARVASLAGWAAVSVQDQGPGIPPEDRIRIFQKFVRGSADTKGAVKGTGIGLAMVDAIVRAHGGRVDLESEPGSGSRFTILLPAERMN
jgi:signal transduction histidine kinase